MSNATPSRMVYLKQNMHSHVIEQFYNIIYHNTAQDRYFHAVRKNSPLYEVQKIIFAVFVPTPNLVPVLIYSTVLV